MPHQGVGVQQGKAGRAVPQQQHHLGGRAGDPGRDRVAKARAQAAVGAGVQPPAGAFRLDVFTGVGNEVSAVPDHHGIVVEHPGQFPVDAHGMDRVRVGGQQGLVGCHRLRRRGLQVR